MRQFLAIVGMVLTATAASAADVSDLIKQLKDKDIDVRRSAAKDLASAGPDAKAAVPALTAALKDGDLFVRRFAAQALGEIGKEAKSAAPSLNALLKEGKDKKEVLDAAAGALGKIGGSPDSVKALASTLKDTGADPGVRRQAAESLGKLGGDAKSAIPVLVDVLKPAKGGAMPRGTDFRPEVATALGEIATPADKTAVDALKTLSEDRAIRRDRNLQKAIADALKKINAKQS